MTEPQRTHPLTPIASLDRIAGIALVAAAGLNDVVPIAFLPLLVIVVAIGLGGAWVNWWRTTYWFDDDGDLRISSGLLWRNERRIQLSRLQSVEVVQPLVARLVGLAEVRPEVAGSSGSQRTLRFLAEPDARAFRAELLARAAGIRGQVGDAPAPEAPERPLLSVPTADLLVSSLLDVGLVVGTVVAVVVVVAAVLSENAGSMVGLLLAAVAIGAGTIGRVFTFYGFTMAESPDGLRLRHGLLTTQSQTVPPGRVQAVSVEQPWFWRFKGWVRITVNVAGAASDDGNQRQASTTLLPVAPVATAHLVLARVIPGVDIEHLPLVSAPQSARWRAPLQHRNLAVATDASVFATSSGWLTRKLAVVPHARTQSVRITQGPWQRSLGLASVHVDSTPGPVRPTARHRPAAQARALAQEQADLARVARASSRPERWMAPPTGPARPLPPPESLPESPPESP